MNAVKICCLVFAVPVVICASVQPRSAHAQISQFFFERNYLAAEDFFHELYLQNAKPVDNSLTRRQRAEAGADILTTYLEQNFPTWHLYLPDCPLNTRLIDSNRWYVENSFIDVYHPDAATCCRSADTFLSPRAPIHHRQQCCYNRAGNLITQGAGAGTPDFGAESVLDPQWEAGLGHRTYDVFTWHFTSLRRYHQVWPPNGGEIEVPGGRLTDAKTRLSAGQCYTVEAHGRIIWKPNPLPGENALSSEPRGSGFIGGGSLAGLLLAPPPIPSVPVGTLLMYLRDERMQVSGPFVVGAFRTFVSPVGAQVFFESNDGYTADNRGAYYVSIRRCLNSGRIPDLR